DGVYGDGGAGGDRRRGAYGRGSAAGGLAVALRTWSKDVVLCTNGVRPSHRVRERLARNHITLRSQPIARLDHRHGMLTTGQFESGEPLERDAIFFNTGQHPQSDLAIRLGCTLTHRGTVETGTLCDTNVPRVFVAGDASRDAQFVVVAAAEGIKAAVAINKALQ